MKRIAEFFEDDTGGLSMYRLTLFMWVSNLCFNWTYVTIVKQAIQTLDISILTLTATFLGGKVIQRGIEAQEATKMLEEAKESLK